MDYFAVSFQGGDAGDQDDEPGDGDGNISVSLPMKQDPVMIGLTGIISRSIYSILAYIHLNLLIFQWLLRMVKVWNQCHYIESESTIHCCRIDAEFPVLVTYYAAKILDPVNWSSREILTNEIPILSWAELHRSVKTELNLVRNSNG